MITVNRVYRYLEEEIVYISVKLNAEILLGINDNFENVK